MNKIILVTGATSGFGQAAARKFTAAGGYDIIITGRRKERLEALKQELEAASAAAASAAAASTAAGVAGNVKGGSPTKVLPLT
ncbi:MAG: SDR family NAD(P)-dependent oxidoreductase, partial [Bacteroidetes bacterium]|nr:SDR family NAD(P)-dependent oxidoreductase [Bacteroidota bacterium]